jgi:hypothetical protein
LSESTHKRELCLRRLNLLRLCLWKPLKRRLSHVMAPLCHGLDLRVMLPEALQIWC